MKARVLFGVGGAIFVLLALYKFPPVVLEALVCALCLLATFEVLYPTGLVRNRLMLMLCMLSSLVLAAAHSQLSPFAIGDVLQGLLMLMLLASFLVLLRFHRSMEISQLAWGLFGAFVVPYLMLSLLRIFQMEDHEGKLLVLLPLLAAWGADTFALFSGVLFGRHKLAPIISPKKTVEGAIGGIIGGAALVLFAALLMNTYTDLSLPVWAAALLGGLGAVLGEIGDLSFSIIKRQTNIKDYGHIFPGHGGVLDRFDSVLFVAPFAELLFRLLWK